MQCNEFPTHSIQLLGSHCIAFWLHKLHFSFTSASSRRKIYSFLQILELLITQDLFNAALPVVLEQDVLLFQYEPFSRGYHVSMEKLNPLIGQSLKGHTE